MLTMAELTTSTIICMLSRCRNRRNTRNTRAMRNTDNAALSPCVMDISVMDAATMIASKTLKRSER